MNPFALIAGCVAIAFALVGIKDQYPFSPFPMYSNISPSVDVLYVTDQKDEPLAISSLFDVGSAQSKKRFEKELQSVAKTNEHQKAKPEQIQAAAEKFLKDLWSSRKVHKTDPMGLEKIKARMITIKLDEQSAFQRTERALGEITVSSPTPAPAAP
jgi:hypothetical protein